MSDSTPDLFTGDHFKTEGIERVSGVAPPADAKAAWQAAVARWIAALAATGEAFTVERVRALAIAHEIPEPHHVNSWGAALSTAAKRGIIERVGYVKSSRTQAHARVVAEWRGKETG